MIFLANGGTLSELELRVLYVENKLLERKYIDRRYIYREYKEQKHCRKVSIQDR